MKKKVITKSSPDLSLAAKRKKQPTEFKIDDVNVPERLRLHSNGRKYFIRTYGCQANVVDSNNMEGILKEIGYQETDDALAADVVILNTCAIRENAEDTVFGQVGALKQLKNKNPEAIIALCGCMVQQEHIVEKIKKSYPQVDLVFGTHNIYRLPILLDEVIFTNNRLIEVFSKEGEVIEKLPIYRNDKIKAFVNIMFGCDKFCTYCIVPYTRGKQRSRKMEDILEECKDLVEQGYQEITLIGQNVNAYGKDLVDKVDFATLLEEVAKMNIPRLRFTTSHPWDFKEEMFKAMADYKNIMPAIHLPLQSGSNYILKKMGRRYTKEDYLALVEKLRKILPNVAITTDIIVGFPNETEEDFLQTLDVVDKVQYDSAFTFIYSPRVGTPAAKMIDEVSQEVKHERFNRLVAEVNKSVIAKANAFVGKTVEVLVEGYSKKDKNIYSGYTDTLKLVNFKDAKNHIGKIIKVKILESHTFSLIGEAIDE